ncbi:hypothetical protein MJO28_003761 [Puccinia striiformis f. sp. tritici]|uniref:Uncharacterized protein n=1 Tax=Puccinia striiformis f. sp. tritici TaxID=168172 RepID=A0ACC0EMI0_9BASI|nr:hypothetical protein MJO28_003761 [Puccinia striiformis f. sp. tritici]
MTWNASVHATWPETSSRPPRPWAIVNADDTSNLGRAPPQEHQSNPALMSTLPSANPCSGVRPAHMTGRTLMFDFFGKEEKQAPSPVSTNLALAIQPEPIPGRLVVTDVPGKACGPRDAISGPSTDLCLTTPPSQVARVISDRIDSASFNSYQIGVAAADPLTTQSLGSTPVACNDAGKTVNYAPSTSNHPDSISPLINNHPTTIPPPLHHQELESESKLCHQRRPINDPWDHQTPEGHNSSVDTKSGQETFPVSWFTERGLNPWSMFPRRDRDRAPDQQQRFNANTEPSPLPREMNPAVSQGFSENKEITLDGSSSKRPIFLSHHGPSDANTDIQSRPAKRRGHSQLLTESRIQSPSTQTVIQSELEEPSASMKQTLSEIIQFDLSSLHDPMYKQPIHQTRVVKMTEIIGSFCPGDQLKIPIMEPLQVRLFFRSYSMKLYWGLNCVDTDPSQPEFLERSKYGENPQRNIHNLVLAHIAAHQDDWFKFWKERTEIDFEKIFLHQASPHNYRISSRNFVLLLSHIDMIGTILENYCLKSSEGLPDCGAKLLQEAAELFKAGVNLIRPFPAQRFKIPLLQDQHISTDAENNKDYYEEALEWVWTWVQNFILQSEEDQLWKILHPAAGLQTNRSDRMFFRDVFTYTIVQRTEKLRSYLH